MKEEVTQPTQPTQSMQPQPQPQPQPQYLQYPRDFQGEETEGEGEESGWKHWGLMVLCCIPMVFVLLLVILGVWGAR